MSAAPGRPYAVALALLRRVAPYMALALVVAQASVTWLAVSPELAIGTGIRVAAGVALLRTTVDVARASRRAALPQHGRPSLPASVSWEGVVAVTLVLLVVALQRAPSRLVVNLIGYAALALPFIWAARRRGGDSAATRAALVVGGFVLLPTHVDWRAAPGPALTDAETPHVWSVGWPAPDWALRHEVVVPSHLDGKRLELHVLTAAPYAGPARVRVSANGQDLGTADPSAGGTALRALVPGTFVRGGEALVFELRLTPHDPALRLLAHTWTAGATRGANASAYFDAQQWWPGTFAAASARPRPGAYMLTVNQSP